MPAPRQSAVRDLGCCLGNISFNNAYSYYSLQLALGIVARHAINMRTRVTRDQRDIDDESDPVAHGCPSVHCLVCAHRHRMPRQIDGKNAAKAWNIADCQNAMIDFYAATSNRETQAKS